MDSIEGTKSSKELDSQVEVTSSSGFKGLPHLEESNSHKLLSVGEEIGFDRHCNMDSIKSILNRINERMLGEVRRSGRSTKGKLRRKYDFVTWNMRGSFLEVKARVLRRVIKNINH